MHANGPNKIYYIRDYVDDIVSSEIVQMYWLIWIFLDYWKI